MRRWVVIIGGVGLDLKLFAVSDLGAKLCSLAEFAAALGVVITAILPRANLMAIEDGGWAVAEWALDDTLVDGLQVSKQVPVKIPTKHTNHLRVLAVDRLEEIYSLSIVDWEAPGGFRVSYAGVARGFSSRIIQALGKAPCG
jgi:hypothetical protein